ncbi:MAG: hypothetical protein SFY32_16775 [Bacteroidota bacterium]|nr:hypothetical protein [Bacteroidota bacterium]
MQKVKSIYNQSLKSLFENINDLIKILIWPIVVITTLILYYDDIKVVINNSSKVTIGSFSMEIIKEANLQGFSELGQIITNLEEEELRVLLIIAEGSQFSLIGHNKSDYFLPSKTKIWEKLKKYNLVKFENFTLNEVENLLISLGAQKHEIFYNDKGEYSAVKNEEFNEKSYEYFLSSSKISDEDKQKLESFSIILTDQGKKAIDIIIKTVINELNQQKQYK